MLLSSATILLVQFFLQAQAKTKSINLMFIYFLKLYSKKVFIIWGKKCWFIFITSSESKVFYQFYVRHCFVQKRDIHITCELYENFEVLFFTWKVWCQVLGRSLKWYHLSFCCLLSLLSNTFSFKCVFFLNYVPYSRQLLTG